MPDPRVYPPEAERVCAFVCEHYKDLYHELYNPVHEDEEIAEILGALTKEKIEERIGRTMDDQKYLELLGSVSHDLLQMLESLFESGTVEEYANTIGGSFTE